MRIFRLGPWSLRFVAPDIYSQMFVGFICFCFFLQAIIGETDPTVKQDDGNATGRF